MSKWKEYNEGLSKLNNKLVSHNEISKFNFIETGHYNHIRDIFGITIASLLDDDKKLKILDFGSNSTSWLNLKNRINTKNLLIDIFDPFSSEMQLPVNGYDRNIRFFDKFNKLDQHYELVILGSSLHYLGKPFDKLDEILGLDPKYVLITHTPISLEETFITKTFNKHEGEITVNSFNEIQEYIEKKNYQIIFKSILPKNTMTIPVYKLGITECVNLLIQKK